MTRGFPVLLALVLLIGIAALDRETDGFRVVTSAGARQLAVERAPQPLPDATLIDQDGTPFTLSGYKGRLLLVDFIYTRCPTICGELGDDFARALALPDGQKMRAPADFLSISFDPSDDRAALQLYAERFGARTPRWRIAVPANAGTRNALLQSFGVVVIPDGMGGFIHNDAIYVVDGRGRLARILDPDPPAQLVRAALKVAAR
jgi:protein SCO1/2